MRISPILRKFLFAIAWLWVISITAFLLSRAVPGDEILDFLSIEQGPYNTSLDPASLRHQYERVANDRGYLLPLFYVSITSASSPKDLAYILPKEDRHAVRSWIRYTKSGEGSVSLYHAMRQSLSGLCRENDSGSTDKQACNRIHTLMSHSDFVYVRNELTKTIASLKGDSTLISSDVAKHVAQMQSALKNTEGDHVWKFQDILPRVSWNGGANQYHRWMQSFFGIHPLRSLADGRDAWQKIGIALKWTLLLNGLSFVLALYFGIRLGVYSGVHAGQWHERWVSIMLFGLFAVPSFWLATLLIYFFASGEVWALLPTGGLGRGNTAEGIFASFWNIARHLILPVVCLTVGSLAYVSRQVKQAVLHEMKMPYVTSMRALGVSEKKIVNKHIVRNAMFPVITMAGYSIPALISGSLIVEVIFSIPGMGRLLVNSLMARDWPVAFPILMLVAAVTILSYLITDIVYTRVDPRVKTMRS